MHFLQDDGVMWCHVKDAGWTVFAQCEGQIIEEDKIMPVLAVTLINDKVFAETGFGSLQSRFKWLGS